MIKEYPLYLPLLSGGLINERTYFATNHIPEVREQLQVTAKQKRDDDGLSKHEYSEKNGENRGGLRATNTVCCVCAKTNISVVCTKTTTPQDENKTTAKGTPT